MHGHGSQKGTLDIKMNEARQIYLGTKFHVNTMGHLKN